MLKVYLETVGEGNGLHVSRTVFDVACGTFNGQTRTPDKG
jgi:hypothetical protein